MAIWKKAAKKREAEMISDMKKRNAAIGQAAERKAKPVLDVAEDIERRKKYLAHHE